MPSHGKDYSPYPPSSSSNTHNQPPSNSYDPSSVNASYYPYYTTDSAQYYSQYYSNYYGMPAQPTSYAQAYIDAAYSESFPPTVTQGYAPSQVGNQELKRFRSNNQQRKKIPNKLPVAYCNECSRPFYSNLDYQNHLKCHVNCPDCGLTLTRKQLLAHRNEAHPKTIDESKDIASYIAERKGKHPAGKGKEKLDNILNKVETEEQDGSKKRKMVVAVGYCKFYPNGKCKKGAGCPYYHELPPGHDGQETKSVSQETTKKSGRKTLEKKKMTSKIVPKDRTKLLELLNEEYMEKDDSILLQVIRYIMDKKADR